MIVQGYPEHFLAPMREELTRIGFEELRTPEAGRRRGRRPGTTLIVVNSICGCAAGKARPGIAQALPSGLKPGSSGDGVRRRRHRSHGACARILRAVPAVVAVGGADQGRQARLHDAAPRDRDEHGPDGIASALQAARSSSTAPERTAALRAPHSAAHAALQHLATQHVRQLSAPGVHLEVRVLLQ